LNQNPTIGIILLAAGSSSRMAQNKLLLKLGKETLLERSIKSVLASSAEVKMLIRVTHELKVFKGFKQFEHSAKLSQNVCRQAQAWLSSYAAVRVSV